MKKILIVIALIASVPALAIAQVHQDWVARYDGPVNWDNFASAIAVDDSGNVYVTGYGFDLGTGFDFATIKYNSAGTEQWVARYNGPGDNMDEAYSIALGDSGYVYVTGYSYNADGGYDYATVKYNSAGVEQWVARYNGPGNDNAAWSIAVDGSGNVCVTGYSGGLGTGDDYLTVKYNSDGFEQWAARYDGPRHSWDEATAIMVDGSNNVYVTGASMGAANGCGFATLKYNSAGVEQWVARYDGPGNENVAMSIAVDGLGNVYVTGYSIDSISYYDYATIKYNAAGVEQWVVRYNGPGNGNDMATSIVHDGSGNVYVTGSSADSNPHYSDYATIKYNSAGVEQWVVRFNGPGNDLNNATTVAVDTSGSVYVTGSSVGLDTLYDYSYDYATIKYNSAGVEQWVARYDGPNNNGCYSKSMIVGASGNIYVTGTSLGSGTYRDYATIKYSQGTGAAESPKPKTIGNTIQAAWPNPGSAPIEIHYSLPAQTQAALRIYDVTGKLVRDFYLTNYKLPVASVVWDGRNSTGRPVSAGIYFIRLETPNYITSAKLVMVK